MNICLSISSQEPQRWRTLLQSEPLVELRCDLMGTSAAELAEIIPQAKRVIVTCHEGDNDHIESIYRTAILAGVWAVDMALTMPSELRQRLTEEAQRAGVKVIISHHYSTTPSIEELVTKANEAFVQGCDIAKIITTATTTAEALVPLGLYDHCPKGAIIAFAMGSAGVFSRRLSLLMGAPHTYAAPSDKERTAVGQPTAEWLRRSFEGTPLRSSTIPPRSVAPPSSKSEAQRAIILATLCQGVTTIENYSPCGDTLAAEEVAKALGAKITHPSLDTLRIEGVGTDGVRTALQHPTTLPIGESALLARLTMPLVALLCDKEPITLQGSGTLCGRDFGSDIATLTTYGAHCSSAEGKMPITILSPIKPATTIAIDGSGSSQSVSGWMVALGAIGGSHTIEVANATSRPYISLTANIMEHFGASVEMVDCAGKLTIKITSRGYTPTSLTLSADWSGAAYFAVAYAIAQSGRAVAERYTLRATIGTSQADEAILDILHSVGAKIAIEEREVRFMPSERLRAFRYDASDTPDLIPTLAILALFCEGISRIGGVHRLANKESNRTEAIVENLLALGARVAIENDELVIEGVATLHPAPLRSHNDHRMVMAMAIVSLFMEHAPTIDCVACVAKSYPYFFEQLKG